MGVVIKMEFKGLGIKGGWTIKRAIKKGVRRLLGIRMLGN
jgi:hypothetical protein